MLVHLDNSIYVSQNAVVWSKADNRIQVISIVKTRILRETFWFFYRQHCFRVSSLAHPNLENCQVLGSDDQICQTWKLMIGERVMIITWSCLLSPSGSNRSAASRMCFSMIRSSKLVDFVLDLKILCLYPTMTNNVYTGVRCSLRRRYRSAR